MFLGRILLGLLQQDLRQNVYLPLCSCVEVVALETAGSGVTCNAVSPGFVDTPSTSVSVSNNNNN